MKPLILSALMFGLVPAGTVRAQEPAAAQWAKLSPDQKEAIRDNFRRFQAMPAEKKEQLESNFQRFRSLSPEQKARVTKTFRTYQRLPPAQQRSVQQKLEQRRSAAAPARREARTSALKEAVGHAHVAQNSKKNSEATKGAVTRIEKRVIREKTKRR